MSVALYVPICCGENESFESNVSQTMSCFKKKYYEIMRRASCTHPVYMRFPFYYKKKLVNKLIPYQNTHTHTNLWMVT